MRWSVMLFGLGFGLFLAQITPSGSEQQINDLDVRKWAENFGANLYRLSTYFSGADLLRNEYKLNNNWKIVEMNGSEMVKKFARDMFNNLDSKRSAVESLSNQAELANMKHEYDPEIVYEYPNAMLINKKDGDGNPIHPRLAQDFMLKENEHFNDIPVNMERSDVQVPVNVYNEAPDVLNAVKWSKKLDSVFIENGKKDPTLTWQYFGSSTGFFRQYPGIEWEPGANDIDEYDCRNRGWYIQAATSPKDIVIVVDRSGSMKGLRLEIAKQTVDTIIDTLADNDFFNVIAFNKDVSYIEKCFANTLVQATSDNKELLKNGVQQLEADGMANFETSLDTAFQMLRDFNTTGQGSWCNQAIMVITDGAPRNYEQIFRRYNHPDRRVRVFSYLIGREVGESAPVKWMACANKGYYTQIATLADVQENVMKYIHVLSRPMVIRRAHGTIWTNVYMDSSNTGEGLALMTTVARPVFDMRNKTSLEGNLLGVVGIDVPVSELMKLAPPLKMGVNGYAFIITNNGYILTHPDLRPTVVMEPGGDPITKPNYNSVDLGEVEISDTEEKLRTSMVKRETGSLKFKVQEHLDNMKRIMVHENSYYFTQIDETPFSLGIAIPSPYGKYFVEGSIKDRSKGMLRRNGLDPLRKGATGPVLAKWKYCQLTTAEANNMTQLDAIVRYLENDNKITGKSPTIAKQCNRELVDHVMFDAAITEVLDSFWIAVKGNSTKYGIQQVFVGTKGGVTRFYSYLEHPDEMTERDFINKTKNTIQATYYKRAAELGPDYFVYSVPFDQGLSNDTNFVVTASTAIFLQKGSGPRAVAAVAGLQMNHESFSNLFFAATAQCADSTSPENCMGCEENDDLDCYLLDDGGYIVVSEQSEDIGRFYGEIDGTMMSEMVELNLYDKIDFTDYQGMCRTTSADSTAAATRLLNPIINLIGYILWWSKELAVLLAQFSLYNLLSGQFEYTSAGSQPDYAPCDKAVTLYKANFSLNKGNIVFDGYIDCNDCQKSFNIKLVPNSNLILLVVDSSCSCNLVPNFNLNPREVSYILPVIASLHRHLSVTS
ncbi:voltage-dependent calcium channel subunit alpha-2/delta-3-like isoform X1 [Branchiostoma lanceolatum]|uniref:voltage-dependent calcium channel subunit alpha-2/delta-3-like isoform X1 n=1 Tax=Branchiostoma lanceolatum TaxID=7740 RepID=UPI0034528BAA